MTIDPQVFYQALLSHDPRFDGKFFVGVSSTSIYCRPVCTARTPQAAHCTYYPSAAAAELAGFRPCLRCRPELAPGNAHIDSPSQLAANIASRIEDGALDKMSVEKLAGEFHVSERHLRRVIQDEYGVSPVELAQTNRLLTAKRLLTDTDLPITEIAFASGFQSLRRFNALFLARYRLSPSDLRKNRERVAIPDVLNCELAYRPPLDWQTLLSYLERWSAKGVEAVDGQQYLRSVSLTGHKGWLAVYPHPQKNTLRVEVSAGLASVLLPVLGQLKRLLDLSAYPQTIVASLGDLAMHNPGLRLPGAFNGFEMAVHAVLSQKVSNAAARKLMERLVNTFGQKFKTPYPLVDRLFPIPKILSEASVSDLAELGMFRSKARAIQALATAVESKTLLLEPGGDLEGTLRQLIALPGIGEWTAQYIAMRALAWPDAFPHTDLGLRKALSITSPRQLLTLAETWRPWRAYAAMHLWEQLRQSGLKEEKTVNALYMG